VGKRVGKRFIDKPGGRNPITDSKDWTHVDSKGQARMVNIGTKKITRREATASGTVRVKAETLKRIEDNSIKKGDVLSVAKVSAIMAAKRTYDLIPMCHPLQITGVELSFTLKQTPPRVEIVAHVQATDRTGVEMEALTAVAAAALTIYDMCKAIDRGIQITDLSLIKKSGGKSGIYLRKGLSQANDGVKG
jgi:cyclic pyranopterin monophosphate synthase